MHGDTYPGSATTVQAGAPLRKTHVTQTSATYERPIHKNSARNTFLVQTQLYLNKNYHCPLKKSYQGKDISQ